MPQFDKLTFFTQIFWTTLVFFTFYCITVRIFLPRLGTILKIRKKKLALGSQGVHIFNDEQSSTHNSYDNLLQEASENSRDGISQSLDNSNTWLNENLSSTNEKVLSASQQSYLGACKNVISKEYLSLKLI
jgi:F0F1-type ATP synthase membrane subunit b/b'